MSSFEGRVAIITGAGSGIGRAAAIRLAKAGATLALSDINSDNLTTTLQLCKDASDNPGRDHLTQRVDVQSTDEVNNFVQTVVAKHETIHHVFNCAGVNPTAMDIETISDEYWHKLIDTNIKGVFAMTRACVPHMKSGSSFVNVSSVCGLHPTALIAVYCATKYAVIGFSKSMALELGPRGIRVNIICPGAINTPTNNSVRQGPEKMQAVTETIAMGRMGTPEECADVVAFLFSDEAKYMNGSVLEIDGGMGRP
jgi:NAD(P)-dependent dehydrogenase (short-subunit alcohol dehydrogenase family)